MTPPQSDYDKRTEELAEEYALDPKALLVSATKYYTFIDGRLSAKQSLVDACRALETIVLEGEHNMGDTAVEVASEAIAKIRREGNYPL